MQVQRLRNVLNLNTHNRIAASFHSTPASYEKWRNKWNSDFKRNQQPSKNYAQYATRQKRADTKKALKDLLLNYGASRASLQDENTTFRLKAEEGWDDEESDFSDGCNNKYRAKSSSRRSRKAQFSRNKRKFMREKFSDDLDDHPETFFHATCGSRSYTWSFRSRKDSFQSSATGFEWREHSQWTSGRTEDHESTSEAEDEICVGSCSDRKILGLPPTGPIKIEDVKNAFRMSALKWHPDKHQGPSQATAEEKFKHCVGAYKSLCTALSSS